MLGLEFYISLHKLDRSGSSIMLLLLSYEVTKYYYGNNLLGILAGADIKEMQPKEFSGVYNGNFLCHWSEVAAVRKPTIAVVNGYAVSFYA